MRFHRLQDWLSWQETLHPVAMDLGLQRSASVARAMALEVPDCRIVTVAGTNGKGSTVAWLAALLMASGRRVGSYTSPHLLHYNERIRVNEEPVSDAEIMAGFAAVDAARGAVTLTYFEFGTLAAMHCFAARGVDTAVLEVGIGGRLDTVNLFDADVAMITSVDIDHTDWLGSDRDAIGREKAGILRPGRPVVCGESDPPASVVLEAERQNCPLLRYAVDFRLDRGVAGLSWSHAGETIADLPDLPLAGDIQRANVASAIMAVKLLGAGAELDARQVRTGVDRARLAGRYDVIGDRPTRIVDVAHNEAAARELAHTLRARSGTGRVLCVYGALADKDIRAVVLTMAGIVDEWYVASPPSPRAASAAHVAKTIAIALGQCARLCTDIAEAYASALEAASPQDVVIVFGSFYTVGAVLELTESDVRRKWTNG